MQDAKDNGWPGSVADTAADDHDTADRQPALRSPGASEADGWQQYRKWISKSPAPRTRRTGLDPNLYTWKGYRTWTEHVKRNWNES